MDEAFIQKSKDMRLEMFNLYCRGPKARPSFNFLV